MKTCSFGGCNRKHKAHGLCGAHFTQRRAGKELQQIRETAPFPDRFWALVNRGEDDDCWEWRGSRHPDGYGQCSLNGNSQRAPRVAWLIANGQWPELHVLHRCDNPPCVNPAHLFLGSPGDNARDRQKKGRTSHGEDHCYSKLTEHDVVDIRTCRAMGARVVELAKAFSLNTGTIYKIVQRQLWGHVP